MAKIIRVAPIENSGVPSGVAEEIFAQIAQFAGYGFNKSHAAAYAAISFRTAYLRTHHPEAFFAAAMNVDLDDVEAIATYASELHQRGISLRHPSVNTSSAVFRPVPVRRSRDRFVISYGLGAIRGLGRSGAKAIEDERQARGAFSSVPDFISRLGGAINKRGLQALAKAGAFDEVSPTRAGALAEIAGGGALLADARAGQMSMFDMMDTTAVADSVPELERLELLNGEFDTLGHFITGHPLDDMRPHLREARLYFSRYILKGSSTPPRRARMPAIISKIDLKNTRDGDQMAILTLSDPDGVYEAVAFNEGWAAIRSIAKRKASLILDTEISERDGERRIIVVGAGPIVADIEEIEEEMID
jgi:DNA polymerase-3 subunit alpha